MPTKLCCIFVALCLIAFDNVPRATILIPFRKGNKWGYVDTTQKVKIPCEFITADLFRYNRARVMTASLYGFIDTNGSLVIPAVYSDARRFDNGFGKISTNVTPSDAKKNLVIDTSGKEVIAMNRCRVSNDGPEATGERTIENGKVGFIFFPFRGETNTAIPAEYDEIKENYLGYLFVKRNNKWGMIDSKNRIVLPIEYDHIMMGNPLRGKDGCIITKDGLKGFTDYKGRIIVAPKYASVEFWENVFEDANTVEFKVAKVKTVKGQFGFVDMKGREYWSD